MKKWFLLGLWFAVLATLSTIFIKLYSPYSLSTLVTIIVGIAYVIPSMMFATGFQYLLNGILRKKPLVSLNYQLLALTTIALILVMAYTYFFTWQNNSA